jgi:predicted nuclease with TOPRIM domain
MIIDTHVIIKELMDTGLSESQSVALSQMHIDAVKLCESQIKQSLEKQYEQFANKSTLKHIEEKVETKLDHLEEQIDARLQPMEERVNDNLKQLEERFNNRMDQLNIKIDQQIMQFTITMGGILVTIIGIILPFSNYISKLFK